MCHSSKVQPFHPHPFSLSTIGGRGDDHHEQRTHKSSRPSDIRSLLHLARCGEGHFQQQPHKYCDRWKVQSTKDMVIHVQPYNAILKKR
jgi:hypothetical protein